MARFTKAEMLEEFKEIVYQYARGASFVMEPESGYRLLFGRNPRSQDDVLHFMNPEVDSKTYDESFSIDHCQATGSVEQFYDYGILGIYNMPPVGDGGANEWTFAFGLVYDASRSVLLRESLNGEPVSAKLCLIAARAFFARLILDGGNRTPLEGTDAPWDMLTIAEVAVLADLDERTVRNATSKTAVNRLDTEIVGSNIYIPREAAVAWLQNKRGFSPTRLGEDVSAKAILADVEFFSATLAGDFVRSNRKRLKLDPAAFAAKAGAGLTKKAITALESGQIPASEDLLVAIGNALGLNGALFALRMLEVVKKEEMQALRRRIHSVS